MYLESYLCALTTEALDRHVPLTHLLRALVPNNHKRSDLANK